MKVLARNLKIAKEVMEDQFPHMRYHKMSNKASIDGELGEYWFVRRFPE